MANVSINTETGELVTQTLDECEGVIERGLKTFVDVGQALQTIRDERLYLEQYARFEDYCKERWGWSKRHCDRLIGAAEVTINVGPIGPTPASESLARPLTKLPADEQADAWEEVVTESETTGEKITAKKVEQVVAKRRNETEEPILHVKKPNPNSSLRQLFDELQELVESPSSLMPVARVRGIVAEIRRIINP